VVCENLCVEDKGVWLGGGALCAAHYLVGPMPDLFHDAIDALFATFVSIFFHISLSGINLCSFTF